MRFFCALLIVICQTALSTELYDCFTFFNELELLKVRFEELYDEVDHFVLVEASKTFAGDSKPLYFSENAHHFEKYKDKIICVIVDDFPAPTSDFSKDRWIREEFQRNAILRGLADCNNEDIILISDLDEIPNRHAISEIRNFFNTHGFYSPTGKKHRSNDEIVLKENQMICELHMRLFLFQLNRESSIGWNGAVKAAPYWLAKKRTPWNIKICHMYDSNLPKIYHAGWHFHSMGGRDRVLEKLTAIYLHDHTAFIHPSDLKKISPNLVPDESRAEWPDPAEIAKSPDLCKAWTETVFGVKSVVIDDSYPIYIKNHTDYYQMLGWID